jgi:hypothetical protein
VLQAYIFFFASSTLNHKQDNQMRIKPNNLDGSTQYIQAGDEALKHKLAI